MTYIDTQTPLGVRPPLPLAYLVVTGAAMSPEPLPTTLLPFDGLRNARMVRQRTIRFQTVGSRGATTFADQGVVIDGKAFDAHRRVENPSSTSRVSGSSTATSSATRTAA